MSSWIIGHEAAAFVLRLCARYKELALDNSVESLGSRPKSYSPWLSMRPLQSRLIDTMPDPPTRTIETSSSRLRALAEGLHAPDGHPVSSIVTADIGVRIFTEVARDVPAAPRAVELAIEILRVHCPWIWSLQEELASWVIPIIHRPDGVPKKRGFSTPLCYGAIFLTFEDRDFSLAHASELLAIDIAHEVGHQALYTLQLADPLIEDGLTSPVYSGVRDMPRPAIMSLHASAAIAYMLEVVDSLLRGGGSTQEPALLASREQFVNSQRRAIDELYAAVRLSPLGVRVVNDFEQQLRRVDTTLPA